MHRIATLTKRNMSFGLNFQPLTDTDSDVQKVKPKHLIDNHAINFPWRHEDFRKSFTARAESVGPAFCAHVKGIGHH